MRRSLANDRHKISPHGPSLLPTPLGLFLLNPTCGPAAADPPPQPPGAPPISFSPLPPSDYTCGPVAADPPPRPPGAPRRRRGSAACAQTGRCSPASWRHHAGSGGGGQRGRGVRVRVSPWTDGQTSKRMDGGGPRGWERAGQTLPKSGRSHQQCRCSHQDPSTCMGGTSSGLGRVHRISRHPI